MSEFPECLLIVTAETPRSRANGIGAGAIGQLAAPARYDTSCGTQQPLCRPLDGASRSARARVPAVMSCSLRAPRRTPWLDRREPSCRRAAWPIHRFR